MEDFSTTKEGRDKAFKETVVLHRLIVNGVVFPTRRQRKNGAYGDVFDFEVAVEGAEAVIKDEIKSVIVGGEL